MKIISIVVSISILIICLVIVSCDISKEKDNGSMSEYTLKALDTIKISIDSITMSINPTYYYFDVATQKSYLVLLNENSLTLQFYDWQSKKLVKKIALSSDGPNGVGQISDFYLHTFDSIFVLASYNFSIAMIDSTGKLKNKHRLLQANIKFNGSGPPPIANSEKDYTARPISDNLNPIILQGDELFMRAIPAIDPTRNSSLFFDIGKVGFRFRVTDSTISYFMSYPELYKQNGHKIPLQFLDESYCYNSDKQIFVYSFPCDNNIYSVGLKDFLVKNYWAGSHYFNEVKIPTKKLDDSNKEGEFVANNYHFERIMYDNYHKTYYRLVWHPDLHNPFSFSNPTKPFKIDLSVIILNDDFEKIGEVILPKSVMNTSSFITQEGIFFQTVSDENTIAYIRFDLAKK